MARGRMVPTHFFKDPDIMNLSKDTKLILIGLVLVADDEGRGVAHAGLLGREIDYPAEIIEAALSELVSNDLTFVYQAGKHRYFQLIRWKQWQHLGGNITPSRYPAPPTSETASAPSEPPDVQAVGENSGKLGENPETSPNSPRTRESNLTESNLAADEEKQTEHSPTEHRGPNVLDFPTRNDGNGDKSSSREEAQSPSEAETHALAEQVARILHLSVTDALSRLVAEYASVPGLSILGEADAAREWYADPLRNTTRKRLDVNRFRNWLKDEKERLDRQRVRMEHEASLPATGTTGGPPQATQNPSASSSRRSPSLTGLAQQDQATKGKHS